MNNWWISEVGIQDNHLHNVVQVHLQCNASKVLQIFKGRTRLVLKNENSELEEFLSGEDGYFIERVGQLNEEIVEKYIHDQRQNL